MSQDTIASISGDMKSLQKSLEKIETTSVNVKKPFNEMETELKGTVGKSMQLPDIFHNANSAINITGSLKEAKGGMDQLLKSVKRLPDIFEDLKKSANDFQNIAGDLSSAWTRFLDLTNQPISNVATQGVSLLSDGFGIADQTVRTFTRTKITLKELLTTIMGVLVGVGKLLLFMISPIGVGIIAVTALAAAFTYLWKESETFRNVIKRMKPILIGLGAIIATVVAKLTLKKVMIFAVKQLALIKINILKKLKIIKGQWLAVISLLKFAKAKLAASLSFATIKASLLAVATKGLRLALLLLTSPIGIITIAIGTLVAALVYLWQNNEGFRNFVGSAWTSIKEVISNVISTIKGLFTDWDGSIAGLGRTFIDFFKNADPSQLMEKFKHLIPMIIGILLGGIPALLIKGTKLISTIADGMGLTIPELIDKVTSIILKAIEAITEKLPQFLQQGIEILVSIIEGITQALPRILDTVVTIITTMLDKFVVMLPIILDTGIQLLMTLIDGIVETIPMLVKAAIQIMMTLVEKLIDMLPTIIEAGVKVLKALIAGIVQILPELIMTAIKLIMKIKEALMTNLPTIVNAGWDILRALIAGIFEVIGELVQMGWELIKELIAAIASRFSDIVNKGREIPRKVVDGIKQTIERMKDIGRNIVQGIIDGITGMFGNIRSKAQELGSNITGWIRGRLGINSPSQVMIDSVGRPIVQGVSKGIDQDMSMAETTMNNLNHVMIRSAESGTHDVGVGFVQMRQDIQRTMNEVPPIVANAMNSMTKAMNTGMQQANQAVRSGNSTMTSTLNTLRSSFQSAGVSAMDGLNQGLLNGRSRVLNTARQIANEVSRTMKNALQINSPSRVIRDEVGGPVTEGLSVGIESNADMVMKQAEKISEAITDALDIEADLNLSTTMNKSKLQPSVFAPYTEDHHSLNRDTEPITNHFNISSLVVREEADIERIARELLKQQQNQQRAKGAWNRA